MTLTRAQDTEIFTHLLTQVVTLVDVEQINHTVKQYCDFNGITTYTDFLTLDEEDLHDREFKVYPPDHKVADPKRPRRTLLTGFQPVCMTSTARLHYLVSAGHP